MKGIRFRVLRNFKLTFGRTKLALFLTTANPNFLSDFGLLNRYPCTELKLECPWLNELSEISTGLIMNVLVIREIAWMVWFSPKYVITAEPSCGWNRTDIFSHQVNASSGIISFYGIFHRAAQSGTSFLPMKSSSVIIQMTIIEQKYFTTIV